MNPEYITLRGIHSIMSDDTVPDAARLLAYQQYISASQVSAITADTRVYAPPPYQTTVRLERLREESLMLQRRLRVNSDLHPAETVNLRQRLSDINNQLHRADAQVTRESNPFSDGIAYTDPDPIPLHILLEANGVMYGSRGLHIEKPNSDYDFAFSYEEHKSLFYTLLHSNIPKSDSTAYFSSVPEAGYHTFFQYKALDFITKEEVKVDILFLHNDEDLDVIRASVQDLQSIPQYMLFDKKFRIIAYNKALQNRGWKEFRMEPNTDIRRHRGMLNNDPFRFSDVESSMGPTQATAIRRAEDGRIERVTRATSWF